MQSYYDTKQRILVVDDDPFISETISLFLRQHGYDIRTAYSAELAMKLIRNWHPELAILDVHLANMNGADLAMKIGETNSGCKLLLFSALAEDDPLIEKAEKIGLKYAYLSKPAHPEILLAIARELLSPFWR